MSTAVFECTLEDILDKKADEAKGQFGKWNYVSNYINNESEINVVTVFRPTSVHRFVRFFLYYFVLLNQ